METNQCAVSKVNFQQIEGKKEGEIGCAIDNK